MRYLGFLLFVVFACILAAWVAVTLSALYGRMVLP